MVIIRNKQYTTFNFNLSKVYKGVGSSLMLIAFKRSVPIDDSIKDEPEIIAAEKNGLIEIYLHKEVTKEKKVPYVVTYEIEVPKEKEVTLDLSEKEVTLDLSEKEITIDSTDEGSN